MARSRSHTREYPFIPIPWLVRQHNRLLKTTGCIAAWRPIKHLAPVDKNRYDSLQDPTYADGWVIEHRIKLMEIPMLKPAWGDPFRNPNKYEVRFTYRDGRFNLHLFGAKYAARKFIESVIGKRDYSWIDVDRLRVEDVRIESKHLEAIMSHTYTPEEATWVLPMPYSYYANYIRTGEPLGSSDDDKRDAKQAPQPAPVRSKARRQRDTAQSSTKATSKARVQSGDGTTFGIQELVEATGKDASKIRGVLRKVFTKPEAGWVWPVAERDHVLAKVKDFLR